MAGARIYGGSDITVILQNERIPCSSDSLEARLISGSSPRIHGKRLMVNYEDVQNTPERSSYWPIDQEVSCDEDLDESFHPPEKKRRLTADQVQFLERSFEVENKLDPERKIQLARSLGLQPRQVAIWFQNRRARWKTKQLEKDYEALKVSYDGLKVDYENLVKEKDKLKTEVESLADKLLLKGKENGSSEAAEDDKLESRLQSPKPVTNSLSDAKDRNLPVVVCKQEELSSATSAVFNSDSPHYIDGGHSSLLEPAASSNIFEADHSDLSHTEEEEEDDLSKHLLPPDYHFPKLEEAVYPDLPATSCNYGFPVEDQGFWLWPY